MKNKKNFTAVLLLALAVLFSSFACNMNTDAAKANEEAFEMNTAQQACYAACIAHLKLAAELGEIDADQVRTLFSTDQAAASVLNFQIVDTKDGTPIAKNASEEVLKARFVPKKK
jgi:lipoprotein